MYLFDIEHELVSQMVIIISLLENIQNQISQILDQISSISETGSMEIVVVLVSV